MTHAIHETDAFGPAKNWIEFYRAGRLYRQLLDADGRLVGAPWDHTHATCDISDDWDYTRNRTLRTSAERIWMEE